jgi:hypothetical protein
MIVVGKNTISLTNFYILTINIIDNMDSLTLFYESE